MTATPIPATLLTPAFVVAAGGAFPVADIEWLIDAVPLTAEVAFEAPEAAEVADGRTEGTFVIVTPACAQRD